MISKKIVQKAKCKHIKPTHIHTFNATILHQINPFSLRRNRPILQSLQFVQGDPANDARLTLVLEGVDGEDVGHLILVGDAGQVGAFDHAFSHFGKGFHFFELDSICRILMLK